MKPHRPATYVHPLAMLEGQRVDIAVRCPSAAVQDAQKALGLKVCVGVASVPQLADMHLAVRNLPVLRPPVTVVRNGSHLGQHAHLGSQPLLGWHGVHHKADDGVVVQARLWRRDDGRLHDRWLHHDGRRFVLRDAAVQFLEDAPRPRLRCVDASVLNRCLGYEFLGGHV